MGLNPQFNSFSSVSLFACYSLLTHSHCSLFSRNDVSLFLSCRSVILFLPFSDSQRFFTSSKVVVEINRRLKFVINYDVSFKMADTFLRVNNARDNRLFSLMKSLNSAVAFRLSNTVLFD